VAKHGRADAPLDVTSIDGSLDPSSLEELLAAFAGYESALLTNDLEALDRYFAPGPTTLRGDPSALLVGHDRISAFRGLRGGLPRRTITELHVRVISPTAVLLVSVSVPVKGGAGLQTQVWQRSDAAAGSAAASPAAASASAAGEWVITAAHVHGAAPALNGTIWRIVGNPLVPALPAAVAEGVVDPDGLPVTVPQPLSGMTVAVKDLYDVAGFTVGAGIPEFLAEAPVATADAPAVAALRAAGASVQGIAQTDEFAYSIAGKNVHYGTPPNAAVPGAIPGGSSSGPASAVALGQATIGLATDTAGSIRVPASYQGLWGIRTTHGSVSASGLWPLAPSFDTVGWLTRSAPALRAAAAASFTGAPGAGFEPMPSGDRGGAGAALLGDTSPVRGSAAPADGRGARVASLAARFVVSADLVASCAPDVQAAFAALVADPVFAEVESVELGDLDAVFTAFRTVQGAEAWRQDGSWIEAHPGVLAMDVAERFDIASEITEAEEASAREFLASARARFDEVLAGRILLLPSASSAAPALNASGEDIAVVRSSTLRMTAVAGTGGYPAVSAPLLTVPAPGGTAPVGLCFVGPRGTDLDLIDVAAAVAEALRA